MCQELERKEGWVVSEEIFRIDQRIEIYGWYVSSEGLIIEIRFEWVVNFNVYVDVSIVEVDLWIVRRQTVCGQSMLSVLWSKFRNFFDEPRPFILYHKWLPLNVCLVRSPPKDRSSWLCRMSIVRQIHRKKWIVGEGLLEVDFWQSIGFCFLEVGYMSYHNLESTSSIYFLLRDPTCETLRNRVSNRVCKTTQTVCSIKNPLRIQ